MIAQTPWGYAVELGDAVSMPPLLGPIRLEKMSRGRYKGGDERTIAAIEAVSAAIRGACHWHIAPVLTCRATIKTSGASQRVAMLPAMYVSSVTSVIENGVELSSGEYECRDDGAIRRCCWKTWPDSWNPAVATYEAGYSLEMVPDLATVAYQIIANHLSAAPGVRSESVGDVSTEYNETASGVSGGVTLLERDLALLAPYIMPIEMR